LGWAETTGKNNKEGIGALPTPGVGLRVAHIRENWRITDSRFNGKKHVGMDMSASDRTWRQRAKQQRSQDQCRISTTSGPPGYETHTLRHLGVQRVWEIQRCQLRLFQLASGSSRRAQMDPRLCGMPILASGASPCLATTCKLADEFTRNYVFLGALFLVLMNIWCR
jgi:hypothetical protein